jgi:Fic family protein
MLFDRIIKRISPMDVNAFRNSPSGRLVPTRIALVPYEAFVPNNLPPILDADWALSNLNSKADRALSELAGIGRNLKSSTLFIKPFMQREAVLSSMIEGTQTEMSDLLAYQLHEAPLPGFEDARASEADNREVLNYVRAMEWGISAIKEKAIDETILLEMHKLLLIGVRGDYATPGKMREEQNYIGPTRNPDDAIYFPPPVEDMEACLKDFFHYIQAEDIYPPLIRLGIVHYQFEAIHPFRDGNGRIGRLLLSLLLVKWGLMPAPLLYLSAYFEENRQKYYELLLRVSQKGDWGAWLRYFLMGVREQAEDAMSRGKSLINLQDEWRNQLIEHKASSTALRLCELLFETPVTTIPEVQKRLGYKDYNSAKKAVLELQAQGILVLSSPGDYEKSYKATRILKIIS